MFLPGPETVPEIGVEFGEAKGEEDAGEEGEGEGEGGVGWHFTMQQGWGWGGGLKGKVWELFEGESRELGEMTMYALPKRARQEPT